jgi:putative membrane protein
MMYRFWDYGFSAPGFGMIFGPLAMIVFIVIAALIAAWILRALGLGWQSSVQGKSPLDLLKERFARGEIDRKEYEQRKQLLSGS